MMQEPETAEERVRTRIRTLRSARGLTLDELARRTHIGASTLSRIETGHRRISLDQLQPIADALQTSIDALLASEPAEQDIVIRPRKDVIDGTTVWPLTHGVDGGIAVHRMLIPVRKGGPKPKVHPGRDWFYVLAGTCRAVIGGREFLVHEGEAAEFSTMTPHWFSGYGKPVDVLMVFDRHGEEAHLRPLPRGRASQQHR
jgi:transcriptional regulator with XRE-family HTH domain